MPAGTEIEIRISETLGTETHDAGASFRASLARSLRVNGRTVVSSGTAVTGRLPEVQKPKRIKKAKMSLTLAGIELRQGSKPLLTSSFELKARRDGSVATRAYWGAHLGAAAGKLIDPDDKKLQRWAAVVGTATALVLNRRKHIELASGQRFTFLLAQDLAVEVSSRSPPPPPPPPPPLPLVDDHLLIPDPQDEEVVDLPSEPGEDACSVDDSILVVELTLLDAGYQVTPNGVWDLDDEQATVFLVGSLQDDELWGAGWEGPVDGRYTRAAAAHLRSRLEAVEGSLGESRTTVWLRGILDALDCLRDSGIFPRRIEEPPDPCRDTSGAFMEFANGYLYDFADDIWCWIQGGDCLERLKERQPAYQQCHPRASRMIYMIGALISPITFAFLLTAARKNPTLGESFLRGATLELIEGGISVLGELLTYGRLLHPGGFLEDTIYLTLGLGLLYMARVHWKTLLRTALVLLGIILALAILGP